MTPAALLGTPKVTSTSAPRSSDTPIPPTIVPCAYVWANKDLPDESAFVQEELKKAGLGDVEAALSAYGENCLDTATDTIVGFTAMQTDFFFSIPTDDLNNRAELGNRAAKILRVVALFRPERCPGSTADMSRWFTAMAEKRNACGFPSRRARAGWKMAWTAKRCSTASLRIRNMTSNLIRTGRR